MHIRYFGKANVARRVKSMIPSIQLIFLFRDPTKRLISRWLQPLERGDWDEVSKFEDKYGTSYDCNNVVEAYTRELASVRFRIM